MNEKESFEKHENQDLPGVQISSSAQWNQYWRKSQSRELRILTIFRQKIRQIEGSFALLS